MRTADAGRRSTVENDGVDDGLEVKAKTMLSQAIAKASDFLAEVRSEMSKVTWPTTEELKGQTLVVIIAVIVISAFIGLVDIVLNNIIQLFVRSVT